jgi:hypothetical protein
MGLTDCQMCGTFYIRELAESAEHLDGQADSYTAENTDDWFVEAIGSGFLEENGFPSDWTEDAMVMFPTGWTRGYYRTWAGRDAVGALVCLLTDFEVLSENLGPDPRRCL